MTNSVPDSPASGTRTKVSSFVQIPKDLIQYARSCKLTGTQYDLWLYLWECDPYGDRWVKIPPPVEIASLLGVDPRTVQRAARRLQDVNLFEFEIEAWKVRNMIVSVKTRDYSTGKGIRMMTKRSGLRQKDPTDDKRIPVSQVGSKDPNVASEPLSEASSSSLHTSHTDPDSLIAQRETQASTKKTEPWFEDSGKVARSYREWLLNRASALPIYPALIEQWIEAQALVEANQREFQHHLESRNGMIVPPTPPDPFQLETACDQAILNGDRDWAQHKLQQLWLEGWHDLIQTLFQLRQDWGFIIETDRGVVSTHVQTHE